MKILLIGTSVLTLPDVDGGAVENLVTMILKNNKNHNITVYAPYSNSLKKVDYHEFKNVEFRYIDTMNIFYKVCKIFFGLIRRIFPKSLIHNAFAKSIIKDLKKRGELSNYDIVIIENEVENVKYIKDNTKSYVIEHLHTDLLNKKKKNCLKICSNIDEFWCVSKFIESRIKEIDSSLNTKVVYNGVSFDKFKINISSEEKEKIKNNLNLDSNDFIITYIGRIFEEKGVLELVKAFNNINKKYDHLKLLIIGGPKDNSLKNKKYVKSVFNEISTNKTNIRYIGKVQHDELKKYHSITDIQVIPSIWEEAFGLVLIEGIISQHAVIITDSGGMKELIDMNNIAVVSRNDLIKNLEKSIVELYKDKELRERNITNSYNQVSNYSEEKFIKRVNDILNERR